MMTAPITGMVVERRAHACPVNDETATACRSKANTPVVIACVFGINSYLWVCAYHADAIEEHAPSLY